MDAALARRVFDERLRPGGGASPSVRVERGARAIREVSVGPDGWGAVVWSDLDDATADREIDDQLAAFAALGRTFEWKLYDGDRPADLADRLVAKGFTAEDPEALMIADIDDLDLLVPPPPDVLVEEVHDAAGLKRWAQAAAAAFDQTLDSMQGSMNDLAGRLQSEPEQLTVVLASAGDRPICAARTEFHPGTGFASLWGGGTAPDWRGRGVYRAVVAHRARQARDRGYRYLRVDAMPASEPILTRLGFVRAGTTTPFQSPR